MKRIPPRPDGKTILATTDRCYNSAIEPFVSFLRKQMTCPVDYVLGLFKKYDIVVLCERMHPETTQYDMIYQLTSDPRFIDKVGVVYTELGPVTLQQVLDELLTQPDLPREQAEQKLLRIYRNTGIWPFWDNRNYYDYLTKLYEFNQTLPQDMKVRLYFSDAFDWDKTTTHDELAKAWQEPSDRMMAERIIEYHRRHLSGGKRHKCLVIMNYRHAFSPEVRKGDKGAASYIFEAFPGQVANVLINTIRPVVVRSDSDVDHDLIHEGKWDAAFEVVGNPDRGFDFQGSPFGVDSFDLFPFYPDIEALHYSDVFTGFVFYKPLTEHRIARGFPGLFDEAFFKEVCRRYAVPKAGSDLIKRYEKSEYERDIERDIEWAIKQGIPWEAISLSMGNVGTYDMLSGIVLSRYKMKIARWLVADKS